MCHPQEIAGSNFELTQKCVMPSTFPLRGLDTKLCHGESETAIGGVLDTNLRHQRIRDRNLQQLAAASLNSLRRPWRLFWRLLPSPWTLYCTLRTMLKKFKKTGSWSMRSIKNPLTISCLAVSPVISDYATPVFFSCLIPSSALKSKLHHYVGGE